MAAGGQALQGKVQQGRGDAPSVGRALDIEPLQLAVFGARQGWSKLQGPITA